MSFTLPAPRYRRVTWLERALMRCLNRRRVSTRVIAHAFGRAPMVVVRHCLGLRREVNERRRDQQAKAPVERRQYKTAYHTRRNARTRRAELAAQKLCINGATHGPATHGVRCESCHETHKETR